MKFSRYYDMNTKTNDMLLFMLQFTPRYAYRDIGYHYPPRMDKYNISLKHMSRQRNWFQQWGLKLPRLHWISKARIYTGKEKEAQKAYATISSILLYNISELRAKYISSSHKRIQLRIPLNNTSWRVAVCIAGANACHGIGVKEDSWVSGVYSMTFKILICILYFIW